MADEGQQLPDKDNEPLYEIISSNEKAYSDEDLYSFRSFLTDQAPNEESSPKPDESTQPALPSSPMQTVPDSPASKKDSRIAMALAVMLPVAIVLVVLLWSLKGKSANDDDLGMGVFDAAGLKGHLITKWDGKAIYRLRIEPDNQSQLAGFAATIANPPYPLSFNIRLKDSSGFALCGKTLPLNPDNQANNQGSDTFQNEIGSNGKILSISTEGTLPCSVEQYKRITSWDLSAIFPVVDVQDELLKHPFKKDAQANTKKSKSRSGSVTVLRSLPAPIEGDTVVVGDNLKLGVVETGSGKVFVLDKRESQNSVAKWLVSPAIIHYQCDLKARCIITRSGTKMTERARLRK
jgi:hypothetical protein